MIIYSDIGDYINNVTFKILSPLYTEPIPQAIEDGEIEPFFIPEKNAMGRSRATIANMIDMYNKNIPFTIVVDDDLLVIKSALDEYSSKLKEYADNGNKLAMNVYSLVSNFKRRIDKALTIYFNIHPDKKIDFDKDNIDLILKRYLKEE